MNPSEETRVEDQTFTVPPDEHLVLPLLIECRASEFPDAVWIQPIDGDGWTYRALHEHAQRWASALTALGIKAGDRVATMLPPGPTSLAIWLGLGWIGAVDASINQQLVSGTLTYALTEARTSTLIVNPAMLDAVLTLDPSVLDGLTIIVAHETAPEGLMSETDVLARANGGFDRGTLRPEDVTTIIFTSGTTGPPKGVEVTWAQVYSTATGCIPVPDGEQIRFYSPFPMHHISGRMPCYRTALSAGTLVMRSGYSATNFWADVEAHKCDLTILSAPLMLLHATPTETDSATPLRRAVMSPVIPRWREFGDRFGVTLDTTYSSTELCGPFHGPATDSLSCGRLRDGFPGVEVRLVDDDDQEVPDGEVGELVVRTRYAGALPRGYLGHPELTEAAWRGGWFHTGDLMRRDDGDYFFVDRKHDLIRRRGENISSALVEHQVNEHPAVLESTAVGVPSTFGGEDVKVFVVLQPGQCCQPRELHKFLVAHMPAFMVPRYIQIVDALPRTEATNRIEKFKLRAIGVDEHTWDADA